MRASRKDAEAGARTTALERAVMYVVPTRGRSGPACRKTGLHGIKCRVPPSVFCGGAGEGSEVLSPDALRSHVSLGRCLWALWEAARLPPSVSSCSLPVSRVSVSRVEASQGEHGLNLSPRVS